MDVLLFDAVPMMRAALSGQIERLFPGVCVRGFDSLEAAGEALAQRPHGLMLLDPRIDGGLEQLQQLGR